MAALMSQKNEERKAAEAQFEALIRNPAQAAPLMCTAMAASADLTVRSMTTIMFRKRVDKAFYDALSPDVQVLLFIFENSMLVIHHSRRATTSTASVRKRWC